MNRVDHQAELALARSPNRGATNGDLIRVQKTAASAFALSCQVSGLEDKEIYLPLGIDAGTFSRTKKGEVNFPADKIRAFCDLVGNTIYPDWIASQMGCVMVMVKSEVERLLDAEHAAREKAEAENKLLRDLLTGRAA